MQAKTDQNWHISFPNTPYPDLVLPDQTALSEQLTVQNSFLLFGCRTGLCGTCLVKVVGDIPLPEADEVEVLQIIAGDIPEARLACQIRLTADIALYPYAV